MPAHTHTHATPSLEDKLRIRDFFFDSGSPSFLMSSTSPSSRQREASYNSFSLACKSHAGPARTFDAVRSILDPGRAGEMRIRLRIARSLNDTGGRTHTTALTNGLIESLHDCAVERTAFYLQLHHLRQHRVTITQGAGCASSLMPEGEFTPPKNKQNASINSLNQAPSSGTTTI